MLDLFSSKNDFFSALISSEEQRDEKIHNEMSLKPKIWYLFVYLGYIKVFMTIYFKDTNIGVHYYGKFIKSSLKHSYC